MTVVGSPYTRENFHIVSELDDRLRTFSFTHTLAPRIPVLCSGTFQSPLSVLFMLRFFVL